MSVGWWQHDALPAGVTHRQILVRHGEPVETARGRCYGKLDVALSERGSQQARVVAERFTAMSPSHVYTSPRVRARETAAAIARVAGVEPIVDTRFAELDFGDIEGMTYDEVAARYPALYETWMSTPTEVKFPAGECFADMAARVRSGGAELRTRHPGEVIAIVAHGGTVRILLSDALGMADVGLFRIGQDYAGVSCVDWYGDTPVVRQINWTP